ncbi:hypothetical protein ABPG72_021268 [Tetrahymena utriculariae]
MKLIILLIHYIQNTEDLPQDQDYENQVKNDNINFDFNASNDVEKNQQVYGSEYAPNNQQPTSAEGRSQSNSIQSQPEPPKQKVAANALDIRAAGHPGVCVTHFILKLGSLLCFFLIGSDHNTICFVFTILFSAFDFWIVKNITGRKLVLLKWQCSVDDNGDEKWVFESTEPGIKPNQIDSTFFWFIQFTICAIWLLISLFELFSLSFFWLILTLVCFFIHTVNFSGFYKCRGEHQKKIKSYMATLGMKAIASNI